MKHARDESLPNERWLPVVGYEGWYDVSDHGRVRRMKQYTNTYVGKILATGKSFSGGYKLVRLSKNNDIISFAVHRLVAAAFIGTRPEGLEVNHIDGNKLNNCVENLEYVTGLYNQQHATIMGLKARGESHGKAKLTEKQVHEIRRRLKTESRLEIAKSFGVARDTIRSIENKRNWGWLKEAL